MADVETPEYHSPDEVEPQDEEEVASLEKEQPGLTWPKKAAIAGLVVAAAAAVAIGLSIGLTRSNNDTSEATKGPPDVIDDTTTLPPTLSPTTRPPTSPPTLAPTIYTVPPVSTQTVCPSLLLNYSNANDTSWIQIAPNILGESPNDFSGAALALSADGRIVAISSTENDNQNGRNAGHIRVFQLEVVGADGDRIAGNNKTVFRPLGQDLDGEAAGDWSGETIALDASGHRLAVGAGWNDGDYNTTVANSGHVRVFDFNTETEMWEQVGRDMDGPHLGFEYGKSVSMSASGNRLAVGASHCTGLRNLLSRVGCVYLYDFVEEDSSWETLGDPLEGEAQGDEFGTTVVLSDDGSHLAVGAYRHDVVGPNGTGTDAGQVALFAYDPSTLSFEARGDPIEGVLPGEWAGMTIALSETGNRIAVGFHRREATPVPGYTRVYQLEEDEQEWQQLGTDISTGGFSVSMSRDGSRVAVGDYRGMGTHSGHVHIYDYNDQSMEWEVVGSIQGKTPQEMAGIGAALSADGRRLAFTAPMASSSNGLPQVGATRVYDLCSAME